MLELGTFGSVRGVPGNGYPYRNPRGQKRTSAGGWLRGLARRTPRHTALHVRLPVMARADLRQIIELPRLPATAHWLRA